MSAVIAAPVSKYQAVTLKQAKSIVAKLAEVKSRQDIAAALAIYHPEGELLCPPWGSRSAGYEQLRENLKTFFKLAPDYHVELDGYALAGDTLCTWGEIQFTLTATFRGDRPNGKKVCTPVFILFRFRDNKVAWESFHFDPADVARQSGVPAEAYWR
jgi:predicted ester cyclase